MQTVSITLKGMSVLVETNQGLTILLPHPGHRALVNGNPVPPGANITISGNATGAFSWQPSAGTYLVWLSEALAQPLARTKSSLLSGAIDPATLNARVRVGNSRVEGRPCSIPTWAATPWQFTPAFSHLVTDTAVVKCDVDQGTTLRIMNGATELWNSSDGLDVTIENEDLLLGGNEDQQGFFEVDGFADLVSTQHPTGPLLNTLWLKKTPAGFMPYGAAPAAPGWHRICMIARSTS